jgi:hypothetical protein
LLSTSTLKRTIWFSSLPHQSNLTAITTIATAINIYQQLCHHHHHHLKRLHHRHHRHNYIFHLFHFSAFPGFHLFFCLISFLHFFPASLLTTSLPRPALAYYFTVASNASTNPTKSD